MSAPLSPEQRAAMSAALAYTEPASGEQVRRALSDVLSVTGHNHQSTILERLRNAQGAVPAIVRRLLDAEARVAELEQQLASANESASVAAEALRSRDTAAELVTEYRVPTTKGRWLSVRREPNGDRWTVATSHIGHERRRYWVGDRWQAMRVVGGAGLWAFDSADAALAEATRLAEAGESR